jgi:RecQ family ATP-dependent DNA helicase
MAESFDHALRLLRDHFGHTDFRPAQVPVVRSVLAGRDTLAVLPTGGGKSVCFQVPALVLGGLTLVVSPLIALMQDQVAAAVARGISAAALHSGVGETEKDHIWRRLEAGSLRLLYVSPERLIPLAPELQGKGIRPNLLAVDEAHCIAEWGHDFRPSYRTLAAARYRLGRPPAVALTGSATPEVRRDIIGALRFRAGRFDEHLGSFDRANLWFGVVPVSTERHRVQALVRLLADDDRMVIVYAPTRSVTEAVAQTLVRAGHRAAPYHAGLTRERRDRTLDAFLDDRLDVIVATCAFGMGIDKPQIRMVVHWTLPATPEAYYQEAGRAGRDGEFARCVLLWRRGDAELHRRQLDVTFPPRRLLERLWREPDTPGIAANVRNSAERLKRELRPERGPVDWRAVEQRRARAEARILAVERYAAGRGCRRRMLVGYFGEQLACCAGCDRCRRRPAATPADGPVVAQRLARLRATLGTCRGAWGAALLEPEVLLALARRPPPDGAALADVPGVGAALAARWGGAILGALGPTSVQPAAAPATARRRSLEAWRRLAAREAGVPEYAVLGNAALDALAVAPTPDLSGLGPRTRAKYGDELLRIVAAYGPDRYFPAVDQGDAEILERIESGERLFRPGTVDERARPIFGALLGQLRSLRERGLIDMPERSVGHAGEASEGYLLAGPCYVTVAGRAALQEFRRRERRQDERRGGDRRARGGASLPAVNIDRRSGGDRRQGDRRR